jgi:hypothetical protein
VLEPPPSGVSPLPLPEYMSMLQIIMPPKQRALAQRFFMAMVSMSS